MPGPEIIFWSWWALHQVWSFSAKTRIEVLVAVEEKGKSVTTRYVILLQLDLKHIFKAKFYPSDNNFKEALLVMPVKFDFSSRLIFVTIITRGLEWPAVPLKDTFYYSYLFVLFFYLCSNLLLMFLQCYVPIFDGLNFSWFRSIFGKGGWVGSIVWD